MRPSAESLDSLSNLLKKVYRQTVLESRWIPHTPTERQTEFLAYLGTEALYGGAAGGGKSNALLMAAAQFVDVEGYAALLLRETFPDLMQPDALIPRSKEWWIDRADWSVQNRRWTFPSGATITFGYLERDDDVFQYQGAAYQFIGIDELTQHTEFRYRYLFSRLRRLMGQPIPLRMRTATNPGGRGHEWVKKRFLTERSPGRLFFPARLDDNLHLDRESYLMALAELDPVTRQQLLAGDWDAYAGGRFKREWFRYYKVTADHWKIDGRIVRHVEVKDRFLTVDTAASVKQTADYTVISVWGVTDRNELLWLDCVRGRWEVPDIVPQIEKVYRQWGATFAGIEGGGTQQGVYQIARRTKMAVKELSPLRGDKLIRATKAIILAETGRLWLPESATWREEAEAELVRFTGDEKLDAHDDIVDTVAYAADILTAGQAKRDSFRPYVVGAR